MGSVEGRQVMHPAAVGQGGMVSMSERSMDYCMTIL